MASRPWPSQLMDPSYKYPVAVVFRFWHALVTLKWLLSRLCVIDNYCKQCGKRAEAFQMEQEVWDVVMADGKHLEVCFHCFDRISRRRGYSFVYRITEALD